MKIVIKGKKWKKLVRRSRDAALDVSELARAGAEAVGRRAEDAVSRTLEENQVRCLKKELCENAITTMAFVSLAENGERSFTFARKPGADMFLLEEDVKEEDIRESCIIHAGSCSLSASPALEATVRAMKLGHEMGKIVSFDVNYRNLMWKHVEKP